MQGEVSGSVWVRAAAVRAFASPPLQGYAKEGGVSLGWAMPRFQRLKTELALS